MVGGTRSGAGRKKLPDRVRDVHGRIIRYQKTGICACGNAKTPNSTLCSVCYDVQRAKKPILCVCGSVRAYGTKQCRACYVGPLAIARVRTCAWCKTTFKKNHNGSKGLYCSRACAFADKAGWAVSHFRPRRAQPLRVCVECGQLRGRHPKLCVPCQAIRAEELAVKTCVQCCKPWPQASSTCSPVCRAARMRAVLVGKKYRLTKTFERTCAECGQLYVTRHNPRQVCQACSKKAGKRGRGHYRERCKQAGVPYTRGVTPLKVFTRDGYRCQLCGCSTPKRLRGTYKPNAPELDHIVPINADEGSPGHVWENVQCSCRRCNMRKSSKPLGQLRLAV